jgi:GntR family transcriptional regulator
VYQDLENEGLIRTRQGTGTFVAGVELAAKDEHRLERATEELERAVDEGLRLQCKPEELKSIFERIIRSKMEEKKGE